MKTSIRTPLAALAALASTLAFALASHAAPAGSRAPRESAPADAVTEGSFIARPVKDARTLPTLSQITGSTSVRTPGVLAPIVSPTDSFLVQSWGFDGIEGACEPRGFAGEDRSNLIFAHVTDDPDFLVNQVFVRGVPNMGPGFGEWTSNPLTSRLYPGHGIAVDPSGGVIFDEVGSITRFERVVPGSGLLTIQASADFPVVISAMAWDPVLGTFLTAQSGVIQRWDVAPPLPATLFGGGSVTSDTTAALANLGDVFQLAAASNGDLFWADYGGHRVRMLRRSDNRVITLVGNGTAGSTGDGGAGSAATVGYPMGVALDGANGLLYFTDGLDRRVRSYDLATGVVQAVVGVAGGLRFPERIAFTSGSLYVLDHPDSTNNPPSVIRRVDLGSLTVSLAAGGADYYAPAADSSLGTTLRFRNLGGLTTDPAGNVFFFDGEHCVVFRLGPSGNVSVVAGKHRKILMGTRALRFGTDMTRNPEEVANWVEPSGYGNGWSQRLVSPPVSVNVGGAVMTFEGVVELGNDIDLVNQTVDQDGEFITVQALGNDGVWQSLYARVNARPIQDYENALSYLRGWSRFDVEIRFDSDNNDFLNLAVPTRIRIVAQTGMTGSSEDGTLPTQHPAGALVVDNIRVTSPGGDLLPALDFEDGTTGGWTLDALNGDASSNFLLGVVRDVVDPPQTEVALQSGFDFNDASCVWTFLSAADTVQRTGAFARLATPWFASPPTPDMLVAFSGKLNTRNQSRFLSVTVRGKNAGDDRPAFAAASAFRLNSGTFGGDVASPYLDEATLRFPADFVGAPPLTDSIQVVFDVNFTLIDSFEFPPEYWYLPSNPTALPYLDDIRFYALGVDSDFDGVANAYDACPSENAAGQDENGDGCVDATATMREVESWNTAALPLRYSVAAGGDPDIADESEVQAIHDAFQVWASVPGTNLTVSPLPQTLSSNSSSTDGINLVTWADPDFGFPPNVVAVTPTTSFTRRAAYQDVVARPGQIVDADLLFNPALSFRTASFDPGPGSFDLLSVAVHEIGHFLGLSHSGVLDASMFFVLQADEEAASLTDDDRAAVASAFAAPSLATDFGAITGRVLRGGTNAPIPGALVTAVRLGPSGSPVDSVASDYTDELGRYALRRLPAGDYAVRVTPLDGEVGGWPLGPEYISLRVYTIAQTNFLAEWWDAAEANTDDPEAIGSHAIAAGAVVTDVDIVTNNDTTAPEVVAVAPSPDTTGINVDTNVLVSFSERIDPASVSGQSFQFRQLPAGNLLPGNGLLVNGERHLIFTPSQPLQFGAEYEVRITPALTDREGVPLATDFVATFSTIPQPPIAITDIQPRQVIGGESYITILGAGFADTTEANYSVEFASGDTVLYAQPLPEVSAGSMTVLVPVFAIGGNVSVRVAMGPDTSNSFAIEVEPLPGQASPAPFGTAPLDFAPTDVAVTPDNALAVAVGSGGLATVTLDPIAPAGYGPIGAARQIVLTPDGLRGYATRPDSGDVVEVDLDPNSGTFRQILTPIAIGDGSGMPLGIVLDAAGTRAFVTDPVTARVYTIDVDVRSVTRNQVVAERADTSATFTEGIAVHPTNTYFVTGSTQAGSRIAATPTGDFVSYDPFPSSGGVAISPNGVELLVAGGGISPGILRFKNNNTLVTTDLALGGYPRDVAFTPQGQSALVVNSQFSQLMVLNTAITSPDYHDVIALVPTGSTPVAVDISADGTRIAVANLGSKSLSLYANNPGSGRLVRATPSVALPGDKVVAQLDVDQLGPGSELDFGGGIATMTWINNGASAGSGTVPGFLEPAATYVAAQSGAFRSNTLPFQIVPPVTNFAPARVGQTVDYPVLPCGPGEEGVIEKMKVSPDGRLLATLTRMINCTNVYLRIHRFDDLGPERVMNQLIGVQINTTGSFFNVQDFEWSPDGREIWIARRFQTTFSRFDADPASPSFGTEAVQLSPGGTSQRQFAINPSWPKMLLTGMDGSFQIRVMEIDATTGTPSDTTALGGITECFALAYTPDGRTVAVGGNEATVFLTADGLDEISRTTNPTGIEGPAAVSRFAFTSDGRYAVGLHGAYGFVSIWNADPAFGAVGSHLLTVLSFDLFDQATDIVPGTDGHSVLVSFGQSDSLAKLDLSTIPPALSWFDLGGVPVRSLARSHDGRRLVLGEGFEDGSFTRLEPMAMSDATTMALVSGADQIAPVSTVLPYPIRVRVTDANGDPEPGALVRFSEATSGQFTIGQGSWYLLTDANGEAEVQYQTAGVAGPFSVSVNLVGVATDSIVVNGQTVGSDAETPPVITYLGPVDGQANLNANTAVIARFNQRMDSTSVASRMALFANGVQVAGGHDVVEDGYAMIFRPAILLPFSAPCSLSVTAGAQDLDAQVLAAGQFSRFTVQPEPALSITSIYPPAGPAGMQVVIAGLGFSAVPAQNSVLFNGTPAVVVSATLSELTAVVPDGAATGDVTVGVGVATSNPIPFTVLLPNASPGGIVTTLDGTQGVRDIAITSNGDRAYATNPSSNSVTAYDLVNLQVTTQITVGLKPQAVAITPDDRRAYVANTDSDNLSVIDTDTTSATYHQVIGTIPVGDAPIDLVVSPVGPEVIVVNQGSETVSMVDANPNSGTYHTVMSTVNTGSGGRGVAISPDGGTAYVITEDGTLLIISLATDQVMSTVNTGSGGRGVAISPDGGLAVVLLDNGLLVLVDVNPQSDTFGQVMSTVNTGSGGRGVAISPDGGLVYVTTDDGNSVVVFSLEGGSGGGTGGSLAPGGTPGTIQVPTLTLVETFEVGSGPEGVTPSPTGGFALVANGGDGTLTVIGLPGAFSAVVVEFDFNPNTFNLGSTGQWVTGYLEPPAPFTPADFDVASIRLEGSVPVAEHAGVSIVDHDLDGVMELAVKFSRLAVSLLLPEGDEVMVHVTGVIGSRNFEGVDSIRVKRTKLLAPQAAEVVAPGVPYTVRWEVPQNIVAPTVVLLHSLDRGRTWTLIANNVANDGAYDWTPPLAVSDTARVAVMLVESADTTGTTVEGVLGMSDVFRLWGTTDVQPAPAELSFRPIHPNPARGAAAMRFGLPRAAEARLELFDLQGRRVRTLASGPRAAGWHEVTWRGETGGSARARSGLYFVKLSVEGREFNQRLVWLE